MLKKYRNHAVSFIRLLRHRLCNTKAPLFTALGVTTRCNYRCAYCYGDYYNQVKENFSTEELVQIISELKDMGTLIVNIIGGEPLLRSDIGILVNKVKEFGMICHLSSNSSLLPEKIGLVKNIDALDTSLDGLGENNDKNRGKGTFKKTLAGIQCAVKHGIKINVNMVLTRYNISDIDALVKMAVDIGFSLSFNLVFESHSCEYINYQDSISIKNEDDTIMRHALNKIIEYKKKKYPIRFSQAAYNYALNWPMPYNQRVYIESSRDLIGFKPLRCFFSRFHCYIDTDGRMYNCMHLKDKVPVVNIREYGVKRAWEEISSFENKCLACYTICNNDANLIFGLKPSVLLSTLKDIVGRRV